MTARILVVDDEPDLPELIKRRFRREIKIGEFEFLFADDGDSALAVLNNGENFDVVLSDINMPRMDGLTLLGHLTEMDWDHHRFRTIMVSAYGDMENIRTAMKRGAFDFVTKPIDYVDLLLTIKKALDDLDILREAYRLQAEAESQRANLSRYFAPSLVETLAATDDPFGEPREQNIAVLFADIVGFTKLCSEMPPQRVFEMLRSFHGRMSQLVFEAGGTLDKYIGDAVMATFGTPLSSELDATNALRCARAMHTALKSLNQEYEASGLPPVVIGIGLHYGPALLGNIGDERRLEFATIGDTVNTASRMERLSRRLNLPIVLSDTLVQKIRSENREPEPELADTRKFEPQEVAGLAEPIIVWGIDNTA